MENSKEATKQLRGVESSLRTWRASQLIKKFPNFHGTKGLLQYSSQHISIKQLVRLKRKRNRISKYDLLKEDNIQLMV